MKTKLPSFDFRRRLRAVTFGLLTGVGLSVIAQSTYTPYTFTTLAGHAMTAGSADGTNSTAQFSHPDGVAVDSAGNVYVADSYNFTIRKVTPAGVVTTLAGLAGISGSADGTNSAARFYYPAGVAVDSADNVYVADDGNSTIRKLTPEGTNWVVTTLAGLAGSVGSADGTNSAARFFGPVGVAVDSAGNVYVGDEANSTIRKLTPEGTNWVVTTLAGLAGSAGSADGTNGAARFYSPFGVAVDSAGNVYVADFRNDNVRKLTPQGTNWVVTTLAGMARISGSADVTNSAARFNGPNGVAVDSAGNVYVADQYNNTIRKLTPEGTNWVVTTLAGLAGPLGYGSADGTGSAARFNYPMSVAGDSTGNIYVADFSNDMIRKGWPYVTLGNLGYFNQQFLLTLAGPVNFSAVIYASANLMDWTPLETNVLGAGSLIVTDSQAMSYSQRFYRATVQP